MKRLLRIDLAGHDVIIRRKKIPGSTLGRTRLLKTGIEIELDTDLWQSPDLLRQTLIHEIIHAAEYILDIDLNDQAVDLAALLVADFLKQYGSIDCFGLAI